MDRRSDRIIFTMALALGPLGILHTSIILQFHFAVTMLAMFNLLAGGIYWDMVVETFLQGSTTVFIFPAEMLSASL